MPPQPGSAISGRFFSPARRCARPAGAHGAGTAPFRLSPLLLRPDRSRRPPAL
jgi:hypothetical protein